MNHTQFSNYTARELLREVDNNPNATPLEKELAHRLEQTMSIKDFLTPSTKYVT